MKKIINYIIKVMNKLKNIYKRVSNYIKPTKQKPKTSMHSYYHNSYTGINAKYLD